MARAMAPHSAASIALTRIADSRLNVRMLLSSQETLDAEELALLDEGERMILATGKQMLEWMRRVQEHNRREDSISHAALAQAVTDLTEAAEQVQAALGDLPTAVWASELSGKLDLLLARAQAMTQPAPRRRVNEPRPEYVALPGMQG